MSRRFAAATGEQPAVGWVDRRLAEPLCSTALFLEYKTTLSREETRKATGLSLEDVAPVMRALAAMSEGIDIAFRNRPALADAADQMALEVVLNGKAEAIVTHNPGDFHPARGPGITIATPAEIIRRLQT